MALDMEGVRRAVLGFPGMVEGTAYGTIAFRVGKSFIGRLRDDDSVFVLKMNIDERDMLIAAEPAIFFLTDHYRGYPCVLIRLAACEPERLRRLVERAWRASAPQKLVAAYDKAGNTPGSYGES